MRTAVTIVIMLILSLPLQAQQDATSFSSELLREIVREHTRMTRDEGLREEALRRRAEHAQSLSRSATVDDYPVSDGLFIESEIHAAVNPTNSDNIIVSAIRGVIVQGQLGDLSCPLYSTTDGGWTWDESAFDTGPSDPTGILVGGGDPVLAFDADGTAYFTWLNFFFTSDFNSLVSELCWVTSTDGGWEWDTPDELVIARANMSPQDQVSRFVDKQWLAIDRSGSAHHGNVYVGFLRSAADRPVITVCRKEAASAAFVKEEVSVSPDSLVFAQFTNIDVDDAGGVHVTFFGSADEDHYALWHARSTDGGKTFPPATKVTGVIVPKFSIQDRMGEVQGINQDRLYPSPQMCVGRGAYGSHVYLTWTGSGIESKEANGTDIYFSRSTDYGATWSTPAILNDDEKGIARDQFYSTLAVNDAGVLAIAWYDRREDAANRHARYYVTVSRDGGTRFTRNVPVASMAMDMLMTTTGNSDFGIGEYTQVLITDDAVIPFWCDGRKNNGDLLIYSAGIDLTTLEVRHVSPVTTSFRVDEIWPQPASGDVHVRYTLERGMDVQLLLTDVLGRELRRGALQHRGAGAGEEQLSVEGLAPGTYQLLLLTPEGSAGRLLRVQ